MSQLPSPHFSLQPPSRTRVSNSTQVVPSLTFPSQEQTKNLIPWASQPTPPHPPALKDAVLPPPTPAIQEISLACDKDNGRNSYLTRGLVLCYKWQNSVAESIRTRFSKMLGGRLLVTALYSPMPRERQCQAGRWLSLEKYARTAFREGRTLRTAELMDLIPCGMVLVSFVCVSLAF